MATVTLAFPFDLSTNRDWHWKPAAVTATSMRYDDGSGYVLQVSGAFSESPENVQISAGLIANGVLFVDPVVYT